MEILVCSVCKHHSLELRASVESGEEIVEGMLDCSNCGQEFPIQDELPNLIPNIAPCLYCGEPVDGDLWSLQEFELTAKPWERRQRTLPHHCTAEALAAERKLARIKGGRTPDPEISRLAIEQGITRDAARKRLKRQGTRSVSG